MSVDRKILISFPGQGGKDYKGPLNPEIALYRKSLTNYQTMVGILPNLEVSKPHVFGYSFGLYAAATVAGVFSQEEAEVLIVERFELVRKEEARRVAEGREPTGMLIIFGQKIDEIRALVARKSENYWAILARSGLVAPEDLHHTNINGDTSHVVSGDRPFLQAAVDFFGEKRAILLPITGMYHAESRRRISEEYGEVVDKLGIGFNDPRQPLIASTRPRLLVKGSQVRNEMVEQICNRVDLISAVKLMSTEGIGVIFDPGPGQFANQSLRRINPEFKILSFDAPPKPNNPLENAMDAARQFLANLRNPGS